MIISEIVRGNNEINWAILLNTRTQNGSDISNAVDALVWNVLPSIVTWPAGDQFVTDISENRTEHFIVYPNPATETILVKNKNMNFSASEINFYDLSGMLVLKHFSESIETRINTSKLATGIYLMKIRNNNEFYTQKITIIR
jgi:hypothetical protein